MHVASVELVRQFGLVLNSILEGVPYNSVSFFLYEEYSSNIADSGLSSAASIAHSASFLQNSKRTYSAFEPNASMVGRDTSSMGCS